MKMTAGKKLTQALTNLKEAIDWLIKISKLQKIGNLAAALEKFLKDVGEVAVRVKGVYEKICEKFCKDCEKGFTPALILKYYIRNLEKLGPAQPSEGKDDETFLKKFKDGSSNLKTCITKLPENLKTFLGCSDYKLTSFNGNGIIKSDGSSSYTPAYQNATWKADEATECAVILIAIAPMLFLGLGYTYVKCSQTKGKKKGWSDMKIMNGSHINAFGYFLTEIGFSKDALNGDKQGRDILSQLSNLTGLQSSNVSSNEHPYNFFKELHKKVLDSTPHDSSHPLTSLYLLSYLYLTSPAYSETSITTSKASIATLGATALAGGAYGLNIGGFATSLNCFFGFS
ncbi:uncharacterized protein BcabD6B2_39550 [Babesia caballi]|uniref:Uncharacterized protein n=1 Tax=Babesia caballi TaxID=5871 RepID=A0AAV4LXR7_BABCB|nr:hypothetical protein, conserved [Babesia caballi]